MNIENKTQTNNEHCRAFWSAAIRQLPDRFQNADMSAHSKVSSFHFNTSTLQRFNV
jgi:hypothetical protein